jgi:hypothetical protein
MNGLVWHYSDKPDITEFRPHVVKTSDDPTPYVWAVTAAHQSGFWFPRDCPRATFWADGPPTPAAAALLAGATRVHAIEWTWYERLRDATVYRYGFEPEPFRPRDNPRYYLTATVPVRPVVVEPASDLLVRHREAGIELRMVTNLWPLWDLVVPSGCEFSGIRLRNAARRP